MVTVNEMMDCLMDWNGSSEIKISIDGREHRIINPLHVDVDDGKQVVTIVAEPS